MQTKSILSKLVWVIVILIFGKNIYAQQSESLPSSVVSQIQNSEALLNYQIDEFIKILNQVQLNKNTAYKISGTDVADNCVVILNRDHIKGEVGKAIYNEFINKSSDYPRLNHGGSLNNYCSKYKNMQTEEKAMVWVIVMTVMAHFESSCSPHAKIQGPNGIAYGFYQLHKGKETSYDGNTGACTQNASLNPIQSSKCTMGMLELQLQKQNGELFSPKSYWDVLRPKGQAKKADDIQRTLLNSSICNYKLI